MAAPDLPTIRAGNGQCTVWQRLRFTRSVEHLPSVAFFEASERAPVFSAAVLAPFTPCTVSIGADLVLTGYIDVVEPRYEKRGHQIQVAVRSKTSDLVDCSVDVDALAAGTGSWAITAGTVGDAAKLITSPYNIAVRSVEDVALDVGYPIPVPPGATCWQILEELGRVTQRLIYDAPDGALVISPVGTERAASGLGEGINIESGAARLSADQRYSKVVVFAQDTFLDTHNARYLGFKQEATDGAVPRNRLLMIPTDLPGPNGRYAQERADWEVARRYGRSRQVQITVSGFRDAAGALWRVNTVVNVRAPNLKVSSEDMIISRVEFVLDEGGSRTTLTCMPAAGLMPAPFHFPPPFAVSQADAQRAAAAQNAVARGTAT